MELVGWPFHRPTELVFVCPIHPVRLTRYADAGGELSLAGGYALVRGSYA